ncbi:MAG: VWA domain-containing protein [Myxococcales bacterium]|nr:VWA domain-containing protein [Myxococcales bacterium]
MKLRSTPFEIGAAIAVTLTSAALVVIGARPEPTPDPIVETVVVEKEVPAQRPRIDVVFALDTTGSMTSMLDGAKQKIWSIANRLASGNPQPDIRIGLVAYRDLGDVYVTQSLPLTRDIDETYRQLRELTAEGGGDTPEHVNKALNDAINGMQWEQGDNVLRLVFLVGDAPPHSHDASVPSSEVLAAQARDKGILINTIRCGYDRETEETFTRIASAAGGQFTSIAQSGGVVEIATPYDDELRTLNASLADTVMNFGSAPVQAAARAKVSARRAMDAPSAAAAASYAAKSGMMNSEDLITAVDNGFVDIKEIRSEEMPEEIKALSREQQLAQIEDNRLRRNALKKQILEVSKKRDAFISDNEVATGAKDGLDGQVFDMLSEQAASIGVAY